MKSGTVMSHQLHYLIFFSCRHREVKNNEPVCLSPYPWAHWITSTFFLKQIYFLLPPSQQRLGCDEFQTSQHICQSGAPVRVPAQDKFWQAEGVEGGTRWGINLCVLRQTVNECSPPKNHPLTSYDKLHSLLTPSSCYLWLINWTEKETCSTAGVLYSAFPVGWNSNQRTKKGKKKVK